MSETVQTRDDDSAKPDDDKRGYSVADVIAFIEDRYRLAISTDGRDVAIPLQGWRIARPLKALRATAAEAMFTESGGKSAPGKHVLEQAFEILQGRAFGAGEEVVHLRAAYEGGVIHVDTGAPEGYIVRIDREGWRLADEDDTPVFRRTRDIRALPDIPLPSSRVPGAREHFAELLLMSPDSAEFRLVWGWLVAAWFASVPRPLLWALGGQGAGKTTRAQMIANLVDPTDRLGGTPGKSERDDSTAAASRYIPTWDNLGNISKATSDWVCRLVTGVGITRRALYSDDDTHTVSLMRTGVATSINLPHGLGPDALERIVPLRLERIAEGYTPDEVLAERYAAIQGSVLAALWDDVAGVLDCLDDVEATGSLRMAGYARILRALDLHCELTGRGAGYEAAYAEAVGWAMQDRVEDDPFLQAVVGLAREHAEANDGAPYVAPPAVLVTAIEEWLENRHKGAVPDARHLTLPGERAIRGALVSAAEPLRTAGVAVGARKSNGVRLLTLAYTASETTPDAA